MSAERPLKVSKSSVAACAAAIAASVSIATSVGAEPGRALDQLQRYCAASWRNAGIHSQDWSDCTQDALLGLLERVPRDRIGVAIQEPPSPEHRELKRAVWRTIQRWRRTPRFAELNENRADGADRHNREDGYAMRDSLESAFQCLSQRQQQILMLWSEGWSIEEIARELDIPAPRASDQKYKAIRKLRKQLAAV